MPVYRQILKYNRVYLQNTSIRVGIEVWIKDFKTHPRLKVTEGEFVYVAIDERGIKRPVNS